MSTNVIRMMAPWLAHGKLEILSEMLKEWLLYHGLRNLQMLLLLLPDCCYCWNGMTLWGCFPAPKNAKLWK